jgi:hypothetical protein
MFSNFSLEFLKLKKDNFKGKRWRWHHGAEDLYYSPLTGKFWCQTEHPDKIRYFFNIDLNTYFSFE